MAFTEQDRLAVQAIRTLSIDAIEQANSGHPGLPMGAAPMAYVLWSRFMKYNPKNPKWFNRDRFVLSAGHGSMLLYSLLHLTGYDVSIDDLKSFRQWGSKTPGHPEYGHTPGVDTTTGPLGQGIAAAVGMAMAERFLAARLNQDDCNLVDHDTYVLAGDGDLMEGISSEASSLAGHLGLNKLIVLYDSNDISLDGPTQLSFSENVAMRYQAYGWNILSVADGNDLDAIESSIRKARSFTNGPTLIEIKTVIGYGSPGKQGKSAAHGSPLGTEEAAKAKAAYGWAHSPFEVPQEVRDLFADISSRGQSFEENWNAIFKRYEEKYPDQARFFEDALAGKVSMAAKQALPTFTDGIATRDAFGKIINAIAAHIPTILGGSADLSGSNKTLIKAQGNFNKSSYGEANVFYGVREHAMGAVLNGLSLHGGVFPFGGTFLVFCDYLRPAIRMSALMKQPVLYVFTHDSIAVGEDGPTHQPVEQLASLRVIPGLKVFRPADGTETALAVWYALTHRDGPIALALTRQKLPVLAEIKGHEDDFEKGGYVIYQSGNGMDLAILTSGSELQLGLECAKELAQDGVAVRVVNFPCLELFHAQDAVYRESVLPFALKKRLAIEMAHPMPWYEYVGIEGKVLCINQFGASAPGEVVTREYGFTVDHVMSVAKEWIKQ